MTARIDESRILGSPLAVRTRGTVQFVALTVRVSATEVVWAHS
jgi:hypothetical protein